MGDLTAAAGILSALWDIAQTRIQRGTVGFYFATAGGADLGTLQILPQVSHIRLSAGMGSFRQHM
jgi:hypothetical protein